MDWIVVLTGDVTDLQELAKVLNSSELSIENEKKSFIMKSSHFTSLISEQEVREKANELLIPINAGIKLALMAPRPIEISYIEQIKPDGTTMSYSSSYVVATTRAFCSIEIFTKDGKIREIQNPADPVISLFKLAQSDPQVAKICQYINLDLNSWFTLYNILEILQEDHFKPIMRSGSHTGKVKDFTDNANNYLALGVKSRHAKELTKKKKRIELPKNPMSLSEAQDFIKMLIHEWLEEKRSEIK